MANFIVTLAIVSLMFFIMRRGGGCCGGNRHSVHNNDNKGDCRNDQDRGTKDNITK